MEIYNRNKFSGFYVIQFHVFGESNNLWAIFCLILHPIQQALCDVSSGALNNFGRADFWFGNRWFLCVDENCFESLIVIYNLIYSFCAISTLQQDTMSLPRMEVLQYVATGAITQKKLFYHMEMEIVVWVL